MQSLYTQRCSICPLCARSCCKFCWEGAVIEVEVFISVVIVCFFSEILRNAEKGRVETCSNLSADLIPLISHAFISARWGWWGLWCCCAPAHSAVWCVCVCALSLWSLSPCLHSSAVFVPAAQWDWENLWCEVQFLLSNLHIWCRGIGLLSCVRMALAGQQNVHAGCAARWGTRV